ncbi:glycosyl transferase [Edwardsiella hoshinae]|uniref:Glycosyl transferase n=1 Tax=Edwardsiella hoshinae TaxID=93378 RepID=A0ABN4SZV7_9GAMM|nr:glycosyltransferase family 2 protein [Edwardsiella hoshinae]AOV97381.1 glycosyl transferase [Edwardsiella hoshinae]
MFSIIIPTYNRQRELLDSLHSINSLKGDKRLFEVIIIDDASESDYHLDVSTFSFDIYFVRLSKNSGPSIARNTGAMMAKYEWLLFLDDDDYYFPCKLIKLMEAICEYPECELFYHRALIHMRNEGFSYRTNLSDYSSCYEIKNIALNKNPLGGMPNIIIKKDLFIKIGMFDVNLKAIEDYELVIRLALWYPDINIKYIDKVLTGCNFLTKKKSVSKSYGNTKQACDYIKIKYNLTGDSLNSFVVNEKLMCAYSYLMNNNRKSAVFYFQGFIFSLRLRYLFLAILCVLSPQIIFFIKKVNKKGSIN